MHVSEPKRNRVSGLPAMLAGLVVMASPIWLLTLCFLNSPWLRDQYQETSGVIGWMKFLVLMGIIWVLWVAGVHVYETGRRLCLPSFSEVVKRDARAPILFLRSFADEDAIAPLEKGGRTVNPIYYRSPAMMVIGFIPRLGRVLRGRNTTRIEEHLSWFFKGFGPVVAVGMPGEKLATPGGARAYLADDEWQGFVLDHLSSAHVVILQPGRTGGVWWEFERAIELVPPQRLLLLLAGKGSYTQLLDRSKGFMPKPLPAERGDALFIGFHPDWTPYLIRPVLKLRMTWWLVDSIIDYRKTLSTFLNDLGVPSNRARRKSAFRQDIYATLELTAAEAASGCQKPVPNGAVHRMFTVPPGTSLPGELTVTGWGKAPAEGESPGNLILTLKLVREHYRPALPWGKIGLGAFFTSFVLIVGGSFLRSETTRASPITFVGLAILGIFVPIVMVTSLVNRLYWWITRGRSRADIVN